MRPCLLFVLALLGTVPVSRCALASTAVEDEEAVTELEVPEECSGCLRSSDKQGPDVPSTLGNGTCRYVIISHCQSFHRAQCICAQRFRGHLVSIHNYHTNACLLHLARRSTNSGQVWIGGICQPTIPCPTCRWIDRSPWNYSNWSLGNPRRGCRFCTALCTNNGRWRSVSCNTRLPFICQI